MLLIPWRISRYTEIREGCESKKCKIAVMCAHAHARGMLLKAFLTMNNSARWKKFAGAAVILSDASKKDSHVSEKTSHVFEKISNVFGKNSHVFWEISHVFSSHSDILFLSHDKQFTLSHLLLPTL